MSNGRYEKETIEFAKIENKIKELPSVLGEYYYTLRAEKKSYRTIGEYINSIVVFMNYVTNGTNNESFYKNVTTMDINKYMISLETKTIKDKQKQTSSSFRAHQWYAINSFFEFLKDNKKLEENPVNQKSRPKITDNASVTYLTQEEVSEMISNIKHEAKDTMVNRDLCLFMLGVTTGLRAAAILQINIEDVDLDNGIIHVVEKRSKTFDVLLGTKVKKILKKWISDRETYFGEADTNALFISQYGQRISYDAFRKLLLKYAEGVTEKKVTPHVLRHTCATNLYDQTGDIYLASAQLHHSNISTTQRYANISNKKMKEAASILNDLV